MTSIVATFADVKTRVVAVPAYMKLQVSQFQFKRNDKLGAGADGQVVRAIVSDLQVAAELRLKLHITSKDLPLVVALKLYQDDLRRAATDATLVNKEREEEIEDNFNQELSIMSSLQGHPNIAVLLGFF